SGVRMALIAERPFAREPLPAHQVRVLGSFQVRQGDREVTLPMNAQRLIAFLAVRQRRQLRVTVASSLWLDTTEDRAAANLRTALWKVRRTCEPLVGADRTSLWLDGSVEVDLAQLLGQARRLIEPAERLQPGDTDVDGLSGDLLPDFDEEWIQFEQ